MNLTDLTQLFFPYSTGLGCGLIYYFLFVSPESRGGRSDSLAQKTAFFGGSLAVHISSAAICFYLLKPLLNVTSSFSTNWFASLFMVVICLISSLFLFGMIKVAPVTMKLGDGAEENVRSSIQSLQHLLFTPHFFWIVGNAVALALYVVQIGESIVAVFTGLFTAFLFWGVWLGRVEGK